MITGSAITDKVRGYLSSVVIARLVGGTKVPLDIACLARFAPEARKSQP